MNISLLSPYHGGSHEAWAQGYREHSRHRIRLVTLPPRFWKWRMHGGAIILSRKFLQSPEPPDLVLTTDMLDLSLFLGLTRRQIGETRVALYMHENQLTYPLPSDLRRARCAAKEENGICIMPLSTLLPCWSRTEFFSIPVTISSPGSKPSPRS